METAIVTKQQGQTETGKLFIILDRAELLLLCLMAEEYAKNHKRSPKAKKMLSELEAL